MSGVSARETDGVSAEQLADALGTSRGSVSTYTRKLVARGFVRRVRRPGDRTHYFVMDADVWAGSSRTSRHMSWLLDHRTLSESGRRR